MLDDNKYNYDQLSNNGVDVVLFDEEDKYLEVKQRINKFREIIEYIKDSMMNV